jgi:hypothetical protein
MLGVTFFGLMFTPVFYVVSRWIADRLPGRPRKVVEPPAESVPPVHAE